MACATKNAEKLYFALISARLNVENALHASSNARLRVFIDSAQSCVVRNARNVNYPVLIHASILNALRNAFKFVTELHVISDVI